MLYWANEISNSDQWMYTFVNLLLGFLGFRRGHRFELVWSASWGALTNLFPW